MTTYSIGHERMGSKATDRLKVEMKHMTTVGLRMNHKLADCNGCGTTLGTKFIKTLRTRTWTAISGNVCCTHWCREDTVTECYLAQLDGAC